MRNENGSGFVQWDCDGDGSFDGCVGFLLLPEQAWSEKDGEPNRCVVIYPCHRSGTTMRLSPSCEEKHWRPLSQEQTMRIVQHLDTKLTEEEA
tara:strand:+ start:781 stop:1059 length:279 start_codon:yes stop_codon:yes gene_type:complete